MDNEFIMISLAESGHPIETLRCRTAPLPDGRRGVLWRGLVWPIGEDNQIDPNGPAFSLLPQPASSKRPFGLIDGAEEAWLVLDGSVTLREVAAGALRRAGLTILRSGPWLGDPVDGVGGAHFIRILRPQADNLRETISRILEDHLNLAPAQPPDPAGRLRALNVELIEARAEIARLRTAASRDGKASSDADAELALLSAENAALRRQLEELNERLSQANPIRPEPGRLATRLQDEITALLQTLRPEVYLLRDSLTVISGEFSNRRSFYSAMGELGSEFLGSSWKKVRGASGWWERHISTGQDDSGRVYARHSARGWGLLVSHKAQQTRDIDWLSRQRLS